MPRAAPDQVHVHRIELGTWERTHLEEMQRTDDTEDAIKIALEAAQVLALPAALAATGYLTYLGFVEFQTGRDRLAEWWKGLADKATGPDAATTGDVVTAFDRLAVFLFGPLGYTGGGTFQDGSSFGDNNPFL